VPLDAVPLDTVPLDAVPLDAVPLDAVPLDAVPFDAVPLDTVPFDTVPAEPGGPGAAGPAPPAGTTFDVVVHAASPGPTSNATTSSAPAGARSGRRVRILLTGLEGRPQRRVRPGAGQQLVMAALLDHPTIVDDADAVGGAGRG